MQSSSINLFAGTRTATHITWRTLRQETTLRLQPKLKDQLLILPLIVFCELSRFWHSQSGNLKTYHAIKLLIDIRVVIGWYLQQGSISNLPGF